MSFDVDALLDIPSFSNLAISPDGSRLIVTITRLSNERHSYDSAIWDIDPHGGRVPQRLTHSDEGEHSPAFLPDGSIVYLSKHGGEVDNLWRIDSSGDSHQVTNFRGGISGYTLARDAPVIAFNAPKFVGANSLDDDKAIFEQREQNKMSGHLYETAPVRYWDHWRGPRAECVWVAQISGNELIDSTFVVESPEWTPDVALSNDGSTLFYSKAKHVLLDSYEADTLKYDIATKRITRTWSSPTDCYWPVCAGRNGDEVVIGFEIHSDSQAFRSALAVLNVNQDAPQVIFDDSMFGDTILVDNTVFTVSDENGCRPLVKIDVDTAEQTTLAKDAAYEDVCVTRDGFAVFAVRSRIDEPPCIVRVDDVERVIYAPATIKPQSNTSELWTEAADGTPIHSWLVTPEGDGPFPLLVFVHGGPFMSWNEWDNCWNPQVYVSQGEGYAVVLPDPGYSTGYGYEFRNRGYQSWGTTIYEDIMSVVDDVARRDEIDSTRVAALGASFGGYMTNWMATQTDRFQCLVADAGAYAIDQLQGTTDVPGAWGKEMRHAHIVGSHSPHIFNEKMKTPMLLTHGELDYRVPVGEALRLWNDLQRLGVDSKFLYFPDEGHHLSKPQNQKMWFETILAFLAVHMKGEPWHRPKLL